MGVEKDGPKAGARFRGRIPARGPQKRSESYALKTLLPRRYREQLFAVTVTKNHLLRAFRVALRFFIRKIGVNLEPRAFRLKRGFRWG